MLTELNKVIGTCEGLMLVEHEPCGEPSLLTIHYVSEFSKQKANVVYISLNQSEEMLRTVCGKLAIRLDQNLFHFIPWKQILVGDSSTSDKFDRLEELILSKVNQSTKTLIIFDNAIAFSSLSRDPTEAIQFSQRIRQSLETGSIILLAAGNQSHFIGFEDIASAYFRLKLVNRGTGKNVTGVLEVVHHPTSFDATTQQHIYHYLVGERSLKLFMPGATQFII
uniref:KaiC-like domain-containing protein n=1 Tax=Panagrolaimus sp. PS1159 TaxID=55785 RepID=A0AC35F835_9BILA